MNLQLLPETTYKPLTNKEKEELLKILNSIVLESHLEDTLQRFIFENKEPGNFKEASTPLIKYLSKYEHPHHIATVTSTEALLYEGKEAFKTSEFLID